MVRYTHIMSTFHDPATNKTTRIEALRVDTLNPSGLRDAKTRRYGGVLTVQLIRQVYTSVVNTEVLVGLG